MKKNLITLFALGLTTAVLSGQTDIFIARHNESPNGLFNAGRVRSNATFDGTQFAQWENRGNAGLGGDGTVWHGFARYKLFERDLFNKVNAAGQITWTTGLLQKEINRVIDPVDGGHDVDVYLIVDPDGLVVAEGNQPSITDAWDWANEFGMGYEHTVYLGRVPQSEVPSTAEERNADGFIEVGSPAMRITFDLTTALKDWINQGIMTENSTIAIGLVQRAAQISENGQPKFDDPELYIHSQMVFEVRNAYIETSAGSGTAMGPGVFSDFEVVDGFVDTGSWLGYVYVEHYPWAYVVDLGKYVYFADSDGWAYVLK